MRRPRRLMFVIGTIALVLGLNVVAEAQGLKKPRRTLAFDVHYQFRVPAKTTAITLTTLIPQDLEHRQKVKSLTFSLEPQRIFTKNGERYARWEIKKPKKSFRITMTARMELFRNDLVSVKERMKKQPGLGQGTGGGHGQSRTNGTQDNITGRGRGRSRSESQKPRRPKNLKQYLASEKFIRWKHRDILRVASKIKAPRSDAEATVRAVHAWVLKEMKAGSYNPGEVGAVKALETKTGDCTEYSDLFVALCRAKGVPARVVEGYTSPWKNVPQHNWTEVWLDDYGWVSFDPFRAEWSNTTAERLRNVYVQLCRTRNNKTLNGYHFYWYTYSGADIQVKSEFRPK